MHTQVITVIIITIRALGLLKPILSYVQSLLRLLSSAIKLLGAALMACLVWINFSVGKFYIAR